jgi:hypothetical protein
MIRGSDRRLARGRESPLVIFPEPLRGHLAARSCLQSGI